MGHGTLDFSEEISWSYFQTVVGLKWNGIATKLQSQIRYEKPLEKFQPEPESPTFRELKRIAPFEAKSIHRTPKKKKQEKNQSGPQSILISTGSHTTETEKPTRLEVPKPLDNDQLYHDNRRGSALIYGSLFLSRRPQN